MQLNGVRGTSALPAYSVGAGENRQSLYRADRAGTLPWYKLLNEIQMFMHQHEVNQQRMQSGLLAINSLWFWGAGSRPQTLDSNLAWYCDDPLLNRFAESLGPGATILHRDRYYR